MKIKIKSVDDLPLEKSLKKYEVVILIRLLINNHFKYYPQIFLKECLYKFSWINLFWLV